MHQRNHYAATAAGSATPDSQGPDSKTPGGSGQALQGSGNQVHRDSAIDSRTTVVLWQRVHERVMQALAPVQETSPEKREALIAIRDEVPGNAGAAQEKRLLAALERFPVSTLDPRPDTPTQIDALEQQAPAQADLDAIEIMTITRLFAQARFLLVDDGDGAYQLQRSGCICDHAADLAGLRQLAAEWLGDAA